MKQSIYKNALVTFKWSNGEVHTGTIQSVGPKWVSIKNSKSGKIDWVVPTNVEFPKAETTEVVAPVVEEKTGKTKKAA
jgi:hypothetical protein